MCPPMLIEEYNNNQGDFEEEEPRDETIEKYPSPTSATSVLGVQLIYLLGNFT